MDSLEPKSQQQLSETGRIEAFSDGMFAIAMTLLILGIKVPAESAASHLAAALIKQWPAYLAFITSFASIGIMWINHHRLFTLIGRADDALLALNTLLLLGITVVPFPTALVAQYLEGPGTRTAVLIYSGTFFLIAIFFNVLWRYASGSGRLLGEGADPASVSGISRQYAIGPAIYLVAAILAYFSPLASLVMNLLLAVYFALPHHILTLPPAS